MLTEQCAPAARERNPAAAMSIAAALAAIERLLAAYGPHSRVRLVTTGVDAPGSADTAGSATVTVMVVPPDALPDTAVIRRRHGLTARQADVARLMAEGYSDKQIAQRFGVTRKCVSFHAERVRAKLGIASRRQVREVLAGT